MNLLDLMVKIGIDDQASGQVGGIAKSITGKLGGALANVGKIMAGVGAAGAAGAIVMAKAVTDAYKDYEQLAGGAQMIFSNIDYSKISADAQAAYLDMGMSANQYLESINQVGAAFKANMGDEAGYETARKGMQAISDYASGTGRSVDELNEKYALITRSTSSYQSIADQFSGILPATSADFLEQAKAAGYLSDQYTSLTEVPIAEYQQAVTNMLGKGVDALNLTGNTAREAMHTISGSAAAARASWTNLLTAIGSGDTDMVNKSVAGLVDSIFGTFEEETGKREGGLINNIMPILKNIAKAVRDNLPSIVSTVVDGAVDLINETFGTNLTADGIISKVQEIAGTISSVVSGVFSFLKEHGDELATAFTTVVNVISAVAGAISKVASVVGPFVPVILGAVAAIKGFMFVQTLIGVFTTLGTTIGSLTTIFATFGGPVAALAAALGGFPVLIAAIVGAVIAFVATNENAKEALLAAWQAVVGFFSGIPAWWSGVWASVTGFVRQAAATIGNVWNSLKGVATAVWNGIKAVLINAMNNASTSVVNAVNKMKAGVTAKWNEIVAFVRGIPSKIAGALSGLGSLLYNAGTSIIGGFFAGMKAKASEALGWVSSLAGRISKLKGPLPYDRKVLIPNGIALMTGLQAGIEKGYEALVSPYVSGLAGDMAASVTAAPTATAGASAASGPTYVLQIGNIEYNTDSAMAEAIDHWFAVASRRAGQYGIA